MSDKCTTPAMMFNERRFCKITDICPDAQLFPEFYKVKPIEVVLTPGRLLFLPAGWFHMVYSTEVDPEIGLNTAISFFTSESFPEADIFAHEGSVATPRIACYEPPTVSDYKTHIQEHTPFTGTHDRLADINMSIEKLFTLSTYCDVLVCPTPLVPSTSLRHHYEYDTLKKIPFRNYLENCIPVPQGKYTYMNDLYSNTFLLKSFAPTFMDIMNIDKPMLWINKGAVHTLLHYDCQNNVLLQIHGTKRVYVFSPSARPFLYTFNPYPVKVLREVMQPSHLIQSFKAAVPGMVETAKTLESFDDNDVFLTELYELFSKYVTDQGITSSGDEVPMEFKRYSTAEKKEFFTWRTDIDIKRNPDTHQVYYARHVCLWFLDSGNQLEFKHHPLQNIACDKDTLVIFPVSHDYAFKVIVEAPFVMGRLYTALGQDIHSAPTL